MTADADTLAIDLARRIMGDPIVLLAAALLRSVDHNHEQAPDPVASVRHPAPQHTKADAPDWIGMRDLLRHAESAGVRVRVVVGHAGEIRTGIPVNGRPLYTTTDELYGVSAEQSWICELPYGPPRTADVLGMLALTWVDGVKDCWDSDSVRSVELLP